MSNEDMNTHVGKALREYSNAKAALAHSEELLTFIAAAHRRVSETLQRSTGSNFSSPANILDLMGAVEVGGSGKKLYLEDGERLRTILEEHEKAAIRVVAALSNLRAFGFGNIE